MKKIDRDIYTKDLIAKLKVDYTVNNLSLRELARKYNLKSPNTIRLHLKGLTRSLSQAAEIAHKKHPTSFKHSMASKKLMSISRLQWMQKNPEKTAWRLNGGMSYPERVFKKGLEDNGLDKLYNIEREKCIFPYYIDFAFLEHKVAVEIDGSQHKLESRRLKDLEKDRLLKSIGWRVYRAEAKQVTTNVKMVIDEVLEFIGGSLSFDNSRVIVKVSNRTQTKLILDKERLENKGLTNKELANRKGQRRVERPSYIELLKLIENLGYVGVGSKFGVSDNTIRKWVRWYEKYEV